MTSFAELHAEHRRLATLLILEREVAYRANEYLLQTALARDGHSVSRDRVRTDLEWLREQGLVTVEQVGSMSVAVLTERGADVAAGRASVPGVKRPAPGV